MRSTTAPRRLLCLLLLAASLPLWALDDFYWESPAVFSKGDSRFPVSSSGGGVSVVAWQESAGESQASISLAVKKGTGARVLRRSVAGPYAFSDTEPPLASVAVDSKGRILLAAAASAKETEVLISDDAGATFTRTVLTAPAASPDAAASTGAVAPRIFVRADGGYLLFANRGGEQSLSIYVSRSDDGKEWSAFEPFVSEPTMRLNFLPTHAALNGRDMVVFQSLSNNERPVYQLYSKLSSDGGRTWSASRLVSNFRDPFAQANQRPETFDNQRPNLSVVGKEFFLVWERRAGTQPPQVYAASLGLDGAMVGLADKVSGTGAYCNNPVAVERNGAPLVFWFDNRKGQNRIYLAQRDGALWQDYDLSQSRTEAAFARPVLEADGLSVFWQSGAQGNERIVVLDPDRHVDPPRVAALNFSNGERVRGDAARFSLKVPDDSSGVAGYSYSWSQDPDAKPPRKVSLLSNAESLDAKAVEDGPWYLAVAVQDYAGNWSAPTRLEFVRDTTAPGLANVVLPPVDDAGFLSSNTFTVEWNPPPASDLAGYTWELEYIGPGEFIPRVEQGRFAGLPGLAAPGAPASPRPRPPLLASRSAGAGAAADFEAKAFAAFGGREAPKRFMGSSNSASFTNQDDGIWRFTVSAVDSVGNLGQSAVRYFKTNKYVPYTYVTLVDAKRDDLGGFALRILGRGFAEGGAVERVFIDRDGKEPYDREFLLSSGGFKVESDRNISGLRVEDLPEGSYRIGVVHPKRGLYLTPPVLSVDETGTVKFGDFSKTWEPEWALPLAKRYTVDSLLLLLGALALFALLGAFAALRGIGGVVKETEEIRGEVAALLSGDLMPSERRALETKVRKLSGGLALKLTSFTAALVVAVVVLVSAPLSLLMSRTQEETLVRSLKDRSRVLLESLSAGARAYLPAKNVLELGFLPDQIAAVPEARYATITGFGSQATAFTDHVWATNDPGIAKKIDTAEFAAGVSRLKDPLSGKLPGIAKQLDDRARAEVGALSASIASLTQEALGLALKTDTASQRKRDELQASGRDLEAKLNAKLAELSSRMGSEPAFDSDYLPAGRSSFIFYKPVMYRQGTEDLYFRGMVRLEVATDSIAGTLSAGRAELLKTTAAVALLAVLIGVAGALVLASFIVRPLRRLVKHVNEIGGTEDKESLAGKDISIRSRDEIEALGDTINEMTHGLVKAAAASKELTVGKDVQKMFIPLESSGGRKLTTGYEATDRTEFFGYYEGAKGVSGDYFNYRKLDDDFYALIKCDVSGKGVPAALIMVEVATLFHDHFKSWKRDGAGMDLEPLVYRINGFINDQNYRGLFAAFTLCLYDSKSGLVRFCNAGDNVVHYYDASEGRLKTVTLQQTPAAGPFPNFMVEMKSGFPTETLQLDKGDLLLLYTDGIEEAQRLFRDEKRRPLCYWMGDGSYTLVSEGLERMAADGTKEKGEEMELLGPARVEAIINAVMNRRVFELAKTKNPEPDERFAFDFTDCEGNLDEALIALVSVEKVFRMYRDPSAQAADRVLVDRKIDAFLKDHFDQYRAYGARQQAHPSLPEYVYYTHMREDPQYDDLTLLGIKRK